jgi:hypothetical protein
MLAQSQPQVHKSSPEHRLLLPLDARICLGMQAHRHPGLLQSNQDHQKFESTMKPLLFLANAFINTFGITQPTEAEAGRSAKFIATLIGIILLLLLAFAAWGIYFIARG